MAKGSLNNIPATDLVQEIARRTQWLRDRRKKLQAELDDVERALAQLDGRSEDTASPRPQRKKRSTKKRQVSKKGPGRRPGGSLADTMYQVMSREGRPMKVAEVAEAVQKTGYQSKSSNFRLIVNQTLLKDSRFKKRGRGRYST